MKSDCMELEPTTTCFVSEHSTFSVPLRTKWLWFRVPLQSVKRQISRLFRARSSLALGNYRMRIHSETRM